MVITVVHAEIPVLELTKGKNVVVFDGDCVLCNGFFNFVVRHDVHDQFHFMTAQSPAGEALYAHFGLKNADYDTSMVLIEGVLYQRMHGVFEVLKLLGLPWRVLNLFALMPDFILDWAYYRIARNRYRLFGKRETCFVPDAELKERFVEYVKTGT